VGLRKQARESEVPAAFSATSLQSAAEPQGFETMMAGGKAQMRFSLLLLSLSSLFPIRTVNVH
jgi:hypothetical protein